MLKPITTLAAALGLALSATRVVAADGFWQTPTIEGFGKCTRSHRRPINPMRRRITKLSLRFRKFPTQSILASLPATGLKVVGSGQRNGSTT